MLGLVIKVPTVNGFIFQSLNLKDKLLDLAVSLYFWGRFKSLLPVDCL